MIPILILAAGQSSRMRGVDKLAEPVDGVPLLRAQVEKALTVSDQVFVALPERTHPRAALLANLDVTLLAVPDSASGQSVTLRGAVTQLPPCRHFMVLLADLPEITAKDLAQVIDASQGEPDHLIWRGATEDGSPGHPVLFDASLRPLFAGLVGDTGGDSIIKSHAKQTRLVPLPGQRARCDLDTPEEWAVWRAKTGR